jgi:hypothetical protein
VIVLSKDIAAKECSSFNPIDSYTRIDVALSKDESAAILQRYQQGEFQATDGHIAVGSYCGGLILDCASDASGCTAQLYTV